jgi:putative SOS response-associated peptidase YedK
MCGRYVLATPVDELARYFEARESPTVEESVHQSYNVAPTVDVAGLLHDREGTRLLDAFHWGLIPSWAKDPSIGNRMFNARAESLMSKPAFRQAFTTRRVAVIADGFYEWRKDADKRRQPFYIVRADGAPMTFAGLWAVWRDREGGEQSPWIRSCTIITTDANEEVAPIHDRMPVLLEKENLDAWLEIDGPGPEELESYLRPAPAGSLILRAVGRRVGNVRNDDPGLLEAVELAAG